MGVSENIVKLRTLTNTTQQQLADIAGVSRSAVSLWEIGKAEPRMGAVQLMAVRYVRPFGTRLGRKKRPLRAQRRGRLSHLLWLLRLGL